MFLLFFFFLRNNYHLCLKKLCFVHAQKVVFALLKLPKVAETLLYTISKLLRAKDLSII